MLYRKMIHPRSNFAAKLKNNNNIYFMGLV